MNILDVSNLYKSYGMKKILDGVSFTVGETEKVGLIGQNGCGKTTLFRLVAGIESADDGGMAFKRGSTRGYLPQDPLLDEGQTVAEAIESVLEEIRERLQRYEAVGEALESASAKEVDKLVKEQEALGHWIDHHQGWRTDHRVDEVLSRLCVPDRNERIGLLSGGMRKRVALAQLVLQSPDLLLLDEPTNHLDAVTTQWLEDFLIAYPGAVMLITHDRYFLDRVAQRIFELESGKIFSYTGGYSDYLEGRAARLIQENRSQGRLITLLRRESEWMKRGAKARQTKQKARIERFHNMQAQRKDRADRMIGLHLETDQRLGHTILELIYLSKSFGDRRLIDPLSLDLKAGDRIGIIGPNGSGKTTLLRMILGEEHPTNGRIVRGKNTKIAYFDQKRECLDPDIRVEDALGEGYWVTLGGERRHKSSYLDDFLFERADQKRLIRTLSGGEKARLILARMMLENANLLILDEPTNDLDIPTLQLLDDALIGFNGSVLMVTHDRFFLDKVATGILSFEGDGSVRYTLGNFEAYQERLRQRPASAPPDRPLHRMSEPPRRALSPKKGLSFKELRELEEIHRSIEGLEGRKRELEGFLADPAAHAGTPAPDRNEIQTWANELTDVEKTLTEKIARWEVLESKRAG
jgi:ATP-binding cassette subfamily F protein uup